jgi:hypothetical protein
MGRTIGEVSGKSSHHIRGVNMNSYNMIGGVIKKYYDVTLEKNEGCGSKFSS